MFIRSIQVRSSAGIVHEYVRVVTSVRENGRVKQKVIANLGRRDTLEAILPLLEHFLRGDDQQEQIAKHGYSRDGKPRNVQVVVGVVMVAGWPIAHHVWAGNTRDSKTVPEVVADLSKRFAFRQVVFVGDRGMVTEKNLQILEKAEGDWGFLVGMTRRQNPEAEALIDRVDESRWIDCKAGITAQEKSEPPQTRVQEVSCEREGVRVFVVDSDERRAYEQRMREKVMERARAGLQKVQARVEKGRLKRAEKIGAAVERVMQRHHGHRYYDWALEDGRLRYFEHPVNLPREKKY